MPRFPGLLVIAVIASSLYADGGGGGSLPDPGMPSPPPTLLWAAPVPGVLRSLAADEAGNLYAAGESWTGGDTEALLAKYDPTGRLLWSRQAEGPSRYAAVAVTGARAGYESGEIYAAGSLEGGAASFGNSVRIEGRAGGIDLLVVEYDAEGRAQWAQSTDRLPNSLTLLNALALDGKGRAFGAGTLSFDDEGEPSFHLSLPSPRLRIEPSPGSKGGLVLSLGARGEVGWVTVAEGGSARALFYSLVLDEEGGIYVCGSVGGGELRFGSGFRIEVPGTGGAILARLDARGRALWARILPGKGSVFTSLATDGKEIYLGALLAGRQGYDLGSGVVLEGLPGSRSQVLLKYDGSGRTLWAGYLPSEAPDPLSLAADKSGVYVVDGGVIRAFDREGRRRWSFGHPGGGRFGLILTDGRGSLFVTAQGEGLLPLGPEGGAQLPAGVDYVGKYRLGE